MAQDTQNNSSRKSFTSLKDRGIDSFYQNPSASSKENPSDVLKKIKERLEQKSSLYSSNTSSENGDQLSAAQRLQQLRERALRNRSNPLPKAVEPLPKQTETIQTQHTETNKYSVDVKQEDSLGYQGHQNSDYDSPKSDYNFEIPNNNEFASTSEFDAEFYPDESLNTKEKLGEEETAILQEPEDYEVNIDEGWHIRSQHDNHSDESEYNNQLTNNIADDQSESQRINSQIQNLAEPQGSHKKGIPVWLQRYAEVQSEAKLAKQATGAAPKIFEERTEENRHVNNGFAKSLKQDKAQSVDQFLAQNNIDSKGQHAAIHTDEHDQSRYQADIMRDENHLENIIEHDVFQDDEDLVVEFSDMEMDVINALADLEINVDTLLTNNDAEIPHQFGQEKNHDSNKILNNNVAPHSEFEFIDDEQSKNEWDSDLDLTDELSLNFEDEDSLNSQTEENYHSNYNTFPQDPIQPQQPQDFQKESGVDGEFDIDFTDDFHDDIAYEKDISYGNEYHRPIQKEVPNFSSPIDPSAEFEQQIDPSFEIDEEDDRVHEETHIGGATSHEQNNSIFKGKALIALAAILLLIVMGTGYAVYSKLTSNSLETADGVPIIQADPSPATVDMSSTTNSSSQDTPVGQDGENIENSIVVNSEETPIVLPDSQDSVEDQATAVLQNVRTITLGEGNASQQPLSPDGLPSILQQQNSANDAITNIINETGEQISQISNTVENGINNAINEVIHNGNDIAVKNTPIASPWNNILNNTPRLRPDNLPIINTTQNLSPSQQDALDRGENAPEISSQVRVIRDENPSVTSAAENITNINNSLNSNQPLTLNPRVDSQVEAPVTVFNSTSQTNGDYVVQIGSYRSPQEAQTAYANMNQRFTTLLMGRQPIIRQTQIEGRGTYYQLRVGPMPTQREASIFCDAFLSRGGNCFIAANN